MNENVLERRFFAWSFRPTDSCVTCSITMLSQNTVMKTMLVFTVMMVVMPIFTYFFSKSFIFEGLFGMVATSSYFYAAISSILVVHVILGMFIYVAWSEDTTPTPSFKVD